MHSLEGAENCIGFHIFTLKLTVAKIELMCGYLQTSLSYLVSSIHFAVENINGLDYGVLPQAPLGIFTIHDLCNVVPL